MAKSRDAPGDAGQAEPKDRPLGQDVRHALVGELVEQLDGEIDPSPPEAVDVGHRWDREGHAVSRRVGTQDVADLACVGVAVLGQQQRLQRLGDRGLE